MHRMIDTATWDDPWFADLGPSHKLAFLYLLTNRRSTAAGAFEITVRQMAFETGLDASSVGSILESLAPRVMWWPAHQVVWVRNFFRHQSANDNFTKSAQKCVLELPAEVQAAIGSVYPILFPDGPPQPPPTDTEPLDRGIDTPSEPFGNPLDSNSSSSSNRESKEGSGEEGEGANAPTTPQPAEPEEPAPPKKRAHRIPADFAISDRDREWAREKGAGPLQIEQQTEKFINYWTAESGAKASKLDWHAAWKVWMARDFPNDRKPGGLTIHQGGKPLTEEERSRIAWRKRKGIIPADDDNEDYIDVKGIAL